MIIPIIIGIFLLRILGIWRKKYFSRDIHREANLIDRK